jgi:hypothetical protein
MQPSVSGPLKKKPTATSSPMPPPSTLHRSSLDLKNHYSQTVGHRAPAPAVSGVAHWQHQQHVALAASGPVSTASATDETPDANPLPNPLLEFEAIAGNIPARPRLATGYHRIPPTTSEQLKQDLQRLCAPLLNLPHSNFSLPIPTVEAVSATPEL